MTSARFSAVLVALALALVAFGHHFVLTINVSDSLPGTIFLVRKGGGSVSRGDLVAFRHGGGGAYERGALFLKRVAGRPQSIVTSKDAGNGHRDYFVDGQYVGQAKTKSKTGLPLEPGPTGTIPPGRYYLTAPHPDSFDSRYALVGWVADAQIVGRAFRVF